MQNYVALVNVGPFPSGTIVMQGETIPGELLTPESIERLTGMGVIRAADAHDAPPTPTLVVIDTAGGVDETDAKQAEAVISEFNRTKSSKAKGGG